MSEEYERDLETMSHCFGLCVGQLREDEMEAFNRLCKAGLARRSHRGAMGLLGLAIADRVLPTHPKTTR